MKRLALVHFHPLCVKSVRCCIPEHMPAVLEQFSAEVKETVEYKDGYPHQLKDGTVYQIVEVEPF